MPPQKNMQRGNWLGNGYLFIVNPTHEFCLLKASLNEQCICECSLVLKVMLMDGEMQTLREMYFDVRDNKMLLVLS